MVFAVEEIMLQEKFYVYRNQKEKCQKMKKM